MLCSFVRKSRCPEQGAPLTSPSTVEAVTHVSGVFSAECLRFRGVFLRPVHVHAFFREATGSLRRDAAGAKERGIILRLSRD